MEFNTTEAYTDLGPTNRKFVDKEKVTVRMSPNTPLCEDIYSPRDEEKCV
jgi:hypothetical protein